jgi:hypothetical protein
MQQPDFHHSDGGDGDNGCDVLADRYVRGMISFTQEVWNKPG